MKTIGRGAYNNSIVELTEEEILIIMFNQCTVSSLTPEQRKIYDNRMNVTIDFSQSFYKLRNFESYKERYKTDIELKLQTFSNAISNAMTNIKDYLIEIDNEIKIKE